MAFLKWGWGMGGQVETKGRMEGIAEVAAEDECGGGNGRKMTKPLPVPT